MTPAVTLEELLGWNQESSDFWKTHLESNPALLDLACDIGGTRNVQQFVRHIWGVELRWAQRIGGLPVTERDSFPDGPLEALFDLHLQAMGVFTDLLRNPELNWEGLLSLDLPWMEPRPREFSRRKLAAHALFHSQRHWAQLATLVRAAGYPAGFKGDLLFSRALA